MQASTITLADLDWMRASLPPGRDGVWTVIVSPAAYACLPRNLPSHYRVLCASEAASVTRRRWRNRQHGKGLRPNVCEPQSTPE